MKADVPALDVPIPNIGKRWLLFGSWIALSSLIFSHAIIAFVRISFSDPDTSYLVLIPFISAWAMFMERRKVFRQLSHDKVIGGGFFLLACVSALVSHSAGGHASFDLQLSGYILSIVLFWIAGFILLFGKVASKAACFSLLFLLLMIPLPELLQGRVIHLLQEGSAWITGALFDLFGVPALREGFVFHLPSANIEIAKECSGIRSSMALLILALLVAHFRLKSFWKKAIFLALGIFMTILKNGIRIATLTLLAIYVDPEFLTGRLHHQGGIVFFLLSLFLLWPVLLLLERGQSENSQAPESTPAF